MTNCERCGFEITELREMDDAKRHLATQAKALRNDAIRASQKNDEFLAILSHELRTPLTTILGWAQELRTEQLSLETAIEGLDVIIRNAQGQKQLIDDLLSVSRIHAGKISLNFAEVHPLIITARAVDSVRKLALAKSIEINLSLGAPEWRISADPQRLEEVLLRLLNNAVKFTPKGGKISIQVSLVVGARGKRLSIQVADTGIGVRAEQKEHIFDLFTQSDSTHTRPYGGLGLGLSISKSLVKMQGGSISVDSAGENKGSIFTVSFPLSQEKRSSIAKSYSVIKEGDKQIRLDGLKILVVDDCEDIRMLFLFYLESTGARVRLADSAVDGLNAYSDFRPDVLLSDIQMPGEDGYEMIRKIRTLECTLGYQTPSIAVTAYAAADDVRRAIDAGFSTHISKPVEKGALSKKIYDLVKNAARG